MKQERRNPSLWVVYFLIIILFPVSVLFGNRAVTAISENIPLRRQHSIIIDAGHGGEDGGATSCTVVPESQINLEITLRLNDLLHLLGYDTRMIRTTDTSIYTHGTTIAQKKISDLKERVRIVNETDHGILVSIHQNFFADSRYSGAQVFFAATDGSEALAKKLQTAFTATLNPGSHRCCKKAEGIYLMEHITCPAILVECGFLSNPEEEAKLRTPDYQKKLCCTIAATVSQYLSNT